MDDKKYDIGKWEKQNTLKTNKSINFDFSKNMIAVQTLYLTKCNNCSLNGVKTLFLLVFGHKLNTCDNVSRGKWVQFLIRCSGICCRNTKITINKTAGISVHALGRESYNAQPIPNYTHLGSRRISSS